MSVRCAGMAALTRVVTALCIIVLSCQRHVVFCGASEQDISTSSLPTEHAPLSTRQRLKLPGKDLQLPQTVSGNSEQAQSLEFIDRSLTPAGLIRPWLIGVRNQTPNTIVLLLGLRETLLTGLQISLGLDGLHVADQWDREDPESHKMIIVTPGSYQAFNVPVLGTGSLTAAYVTSFGEVRAFCVNLEVQAGWEYTIPAEQEGGSEFIGLVWFWPLCALIAGITAVRWSVFAISRRSDSKQPDTRW